MPLVRSGSVRFGSTRRARVIPLRIAALSLAAFLVGWTVPAFANTAFTTWQFIDSTPYSCGYYRNHVDNSGYLAAATTKNVVYYSGNPCNQSNGLTALPTNYLRVNVNLIDEDGQWLCGASGNVYNAGGSASSVAVTVNYVANAGCQLHAGDYFHASGSGARWNTTLGGYVSNGSITSPHLPFN